MSSLEVYGLVVLGVAAYLLLTGAVAEYASHRGYFREEAFAAGVFWPVVLPIFLGRAVGKRAAK